MAVYKNSPLRRHLPEYATEIALVSISLGLFVFYWLTAHMLEGSTGDFDRRILLWFRNAEDVGDPIGPDSLEVLIRDVTALGGVLILSLLSLFTCGYLWLRRQPGLALFVAVSVTLGTLINTVLKEVIARARPEVFAHATDAAFSSFPSGHAMMSTMVYLTLGVLLSLSTENRRLKNYFLAWSICLPLIVGLSRLYLGVHWPTDILAGWIAGATWSLTSLWIYHHFFNGQSRSRHR